MISIFECFLNAQSKFSNRWAVGVYQLSGTLAVCSAAFTGNNFNDYLHCRLTTLNFFSLQFFTKSATGTLGVTARVPEIENVMIS